MKFCRIGIHNYSMMEEYSTEKFNKTWDANTVHKYVRITFKKFCEGCGKVDFVTEEVMVGYGKWEDDESV